MVPSALVSVLRAEQTMATRWWTRCELYQTNLNQQNSFKTTIGPSRELSPHNIPSDLISELPDTGPAELLDNPAAFGIARSHGEVSVRAIRGRALRERVQCHFEYYYFSGEKGILFLFLFLGVCVEWKWLWGGGAFLLTVEMAVFFFSF